jgi:Rad3-related DNA helicase
VAARLRRLLRHDRLIWHSRDRDNKQEQYQEFRNSPWYDNKVFLASGLNEGVDLKGNAGRWQVITQVPYPDQTDPGIRAKMELDPDWYAWQAVRTMRQTFGRICRAPNDYGETFIYDKQFKELYRRTQDMWAYHEKLAFSGLTK